MRASSGLQVKTDTDHTTLPGIGATRVTGLSLSDCGLTGAIFRPIGFLVREMGWEVFAYICWLLCHNFRILQGSKPQYFRPKVGNLHTRLTPNCSLVPAVFSSLPAPSLWIYAPNAPYLCCGVYAFSLFLLQDALKLHLCYGRCSLLFQSEWCSMVWVTGQHCAQSLYHLSFNRLHAHCIFLSKAEHQTFPPGQVL